MSSGWEDRAECIHICVWKRIEYVSPGHGYSCITTSMDVFPPRRCRVARSERNQHQELLEVEEASYLREKRQLQAETLAVEELLKGLAEVEGEDMGVVTSCGSSDREPTAVEECGHIYHLLGFRLGSGVLIA